MVSLKDKPYGGVTKNWRWETVIHVRSFCESVIWALIWAFVYLTWPVLKQEKKIHFGRFWFCQNHHWARCFPPVQLLLCIDFLEFKGWIPNSLLAIHQPLFLPPWMTLGVPVYTPWPGHQLFDLMSCFWAISLVPPGVSAWPFPSVVVGLFNNNESRH